MVPWRSLLGGNQNPSSSHIHSCCRRLTALPKSKGSLCFSDPAPLHPTDKGVEVQGRDLQP